MAHQPALTDAFFHAIPKADIHCHLYGAIRESTFQDFAKTVAAPISAEEIATFFVRGEKPKGVLHAFRFMEQHIFSRPAFLHRMTRECLEDMARENVRYAGSCPRRWCSFGSCRAFRTEPGMD